MPKMKINRKELIKKYIEFFKSKNHKEIKNSSLIPENDPTVLFTTAGMHPLVPFLLGEKHPQGKRLVNVQKCIRTQDIDEVGDSFHHTFFEMLGNWSLGDYWKQEAIEMSFNFLTKELKIPREEIFITCFKGDKSINVDKDTISAEIWEKLGIKKNNIKFLEKKDNWWGPAGETGPCGPDTEMFVKGIEIWNDVFMQYEKSKNKKFIPATQKNVDTGMGVERTVTILSGLNDNYLADMWLPLIKQIEKISKKKYGSKDKETTKAMRIIADHIKAAVFIIAEGIVPSNTEQGYVLRRLIRRAIRYGKKLGIPLDKDLTTPIVEETLKIYKDYEILNNNKQKIIDELNKEEDKFEKTLEEGLRKLKKMAGNKKISGKDAFLLYQSYGFPIEMTQEIATEEWSASVDFAGFQKELARHQELSRTASAGRFKSGLADHSEQTTKLHTAAHLMLAGLRKLINPDIEQRGSNINAERLRFDFTFDRKLEEKEIKKIEDFVNSAISQKIDVEKKEMSLDEAKKSGALGIFEDKYGDKVSVYKVGQISNEICAGPHVSNTKELGKFKITKQDSSGAGVRRIKAVLE